MLQLIQEKEIGLIEEIENKLSKELTYLDSKRSTNQKGIENIEAFQRSWHGLGETTDLQILSNIEFLVGESEKACLDPKVVKFNTPIPKIERSLEFQNMSKNFISNMHRVDSETEIKPEREIKSIRESRNFTNDFQKEKVTQRINTRMVTVQK
jgi:hypothetical protein